jgi:DNA-binding transcriptional LysR family regulator
MRFDLYTLQLFVAVVETGSISAAAEREHIAGSALSKRITDLEQTVGLPLLMRQSRGVEPTVAGKVLASRARTMLHNAVDLEAEMRDFSDGVRGQVRIFTTVSMIMQFLPDELRRFNILHPNVMIDLEERISDVITRAVHDNVADIGIFNHVEEDYGLTIFPYHEDHLSLVVPKGHALASRRSVAFSEALDYDFVGMHKGSALNFLLMRGANAANRSLRLRYQVTGFDSVVAMVRAGLGLGVVPSHAAKALYSLVQDIEVVAITDAWATRRGKICVRSVDSLPKVARLLLDHLRHEAEPV